MQCNVKKSNTRRPPTVNHYPVLSSIHTDGSPSFTLTATTR